MTLSDAELLRRYVTESDDAAFAEVVQRHLKLVYFAAWRRTGDPHLAEDVAQYVFTALARDAAVLSQHGVLTGWLYTTTRFASAKLLRAERRRRVREKEASLMHDSSSSPVAHAPPSSADWEKMRPVVDAALDELGEGDRAAVLLRFFEERPFAEIGAALRVTEDAARMRVSRALEKLRVLLERRGIASTAAALGGALGNHATAALPAGLSGSVTAAALAAKATVSTSGVAGGLIFMNATKTIGTVAGALLLLIGGGSAVVAVRERRDAERELGAVQGAMAAANLRFAETERRVAAAEADVARLALEAKAASAVAPPPVNPEAEAVKQAAAAWDPVEEGRGLMERHPTLKAAVIARADAGTRFRFEHLLRELGLTAQQIEEFVVVMREQSFQGAPFGPNGMMYAFPAGTGVESDEMMRRLAEVMGSENYAKLSELHRRAEAARVAISVASKLVLTDEPATTAQTDELQRILLNNRNVGAKRGQQG